MWVSIDGLGWPAGARGLIVDADELRPTADGVEDGSSTGSRRMGAEGTDEDEEDGGRPVIDMEDVSWEASESDVGRDGRGFSGDGEGSARIAR